VVWGHSRARSNVSTAHQSSALQSLISRRKIAEHVASSVSEEKCILIDAFAGAGGNAIAFAKSGKWRRVYAIEKDSNVLECAKHNAEVYGVQDKITWFEGDCFEIIKTQLKALGEYCVIFASPPWGGLCHYQSQLCKY
jgi:tRNA G37 N-methylase Trm5